MAITKTELKLDKDIGWGTIDKTQSFVPAVGEFSVTAKGRGAFDINCAVKVLFDGALIWFTKGIDKTDEPLRFTGDGVKKVELWLDANDLPSGSVLLGGTVKIQQET